MIYLITLLLWLVPSLALSQATWPNRPASLGTILDCSFSVKPTPSRDPAGCGINNIYNSGSIETDSTAPVSPSSTYKSAIQAGQATGGSQLEYVTPAFARELYIGTMWRTNAGFDGRQVGNKLYFQGSTQGSGLFLFLGTPPMRNGGCGYISWSFNSFAWDNSHIATGGGLGLANNVSAGTLCTNRWTKIESYIKASTTATSRDGIIRWWVDGTLVGNWTNVNYAPNGLNFWTWTETWDGTVNPVPTQEWAHYIDHLVVAVSNGGTSIDNPPGAPGIVTGFTATPGGVQ